MEYVNFIKAELLILIPFLYIIGNILRDSQVPNTKIPLILTLISVTLSLAYIYIGAEITTIKQAVEIIITSLVQGVLVAGATVYGDNIVKQYKKERGI